MNSKKLQKALAFVCISTVYCSCTTNDKQAKDYTPAEIKKTAYSVGGTSFNMVTVDGGSFLMGAQNTDSTKAYYDTTATDIELPTHKVKVTSFTIGETEVTQGLWKAVMGTPLKWEESIGINDSFPAYNVSYDNAQAFIRALNDSLHQSNQLPTEQNVCLPTEEEWEYAAKGGINNQPYKYSGSDELDEVGWYETNSGMKVHAVAQKKQNTAGIYDMSGNVWEWCANEKYDYAEKAPNEKACEKRKASVVIRGGSYGYDAHGARITCRGYNFSWYKDKYIGFRLCIK